MICEEYNWVWPKEGKRYRKSTGRKVEVLGYCMDDDGDNQPYAAAVIVDEEGFLCSCPLSLLKPVSDEDQLEFDFGL